MTEEKIDRVLYWTFRILHLTLMFVLCILLATWTESLWKTLLVAILVGVYGAAVHAAASIKKKID